MIGHTLLDEQFIQPCGLVFDPIAKWLIGLPLFEKGFAFLLGEFQAFTVSVAARSGAEFYLPIEMKTVRFPPIPAEPPMSHFFLLLSSA